MTAEQRAAGAAEDRTRRAAPKRIADHGAADAARNRTDRTVTAAAFMPIITGATLIVMAIAPVTGLRRSGYRHRRCHHRGQRPPCDLALHRSSPLDYSSSIRSPTRKPATKHGGPKFPANGRGWRAHLQRAVPRSIDGTARIVASTLTELKPPAFTAARA